MSDTELDDVAMLNVNPSTETAIILMITEGNIAAEKANAVTVDSPETVKDATADLVIIAGIKKRMTVKQKEYTEPLDSYRKEILEYFKTIMEPILYADTTLRGKVIAYQNEQERIQREQQRIADDKARLAREEAELTGVEPEPVDTMPVQYSKPATPGRMKIWKWELEDKAKVPLDYMIVDSASITKAVKASKGTMTIPGIRIYEEGTLQVKAN